MTSRWLAFGSNAANGVRAALVALAGLTSDLNLFESEFFPWVYNLTPDVVTLSNGFGDGTAVTGILPSSRGALHDKPWQQHKH